MEHACVSCDTTIQAQSHSPRNTYSSPIIHIFQQLVEGPWHNTQPVGLSLSTDLHAVGVLVRAVHGTLVLSIALGKPAGGGHRHTTRLVLRQSGMAILSFCQHCQGMESTAQPAIQVYTMVTSTCDTPPLPRPIRYDRPGLLSGVEVDTQEVQAALDQPALLICKLGQVAARTALQR